MLDTDVSRRDFLAFTAMATAAPRFVLRNLYGQTITTGSGEHKYEVIHDWLKPADGILYGDTHGLAADSQGRIYLAHTVHSASTKPDAVCVFDHEGKFIKSWGSEFRGGAHGLDLRKEGSQEFLYHCDTNRRLVVKTTLDGEVVWSKGVPMESGVYKDASRWCPTNVAFAPNGDLFVGDGYGSSYIHRYAINGDYKGVVVGPGSDFGKVSCPHGLWVDERHGYAELAVADRGNRRVQYFSMDGKHLRYLHDGLRMPCHLHYNSKGEMLVPDLESVVTVLDRENRPVVHLGDGHPSKLRGAPREKFIPGKFVHPHAAIWLNDRDIVVAEWVPIGRVTLLRKVD